MTRPARMDLARAQWSRNGGGVVVTVTRNGRRAGYYLLGLLFRADAARAIRECRRRLA